MVVEFAVSLVRYQRQSYKNGKFRMFFVKNK